MRDTLLTHPLSRLRSSELSLSPCRSQRLVSPLASHPCPTSSSETTKLTKPEIDNIFTRENRYEAEKILVDQNVPFQINVYGGVEHGFALRADMSVKKNLYAMEDAFKQATNWFENWL